MRIRRTLGTLGLLCALTLTVRTGAQSPAREIQRAGESIRQGDYAVALRSLQALRERHPDNGDVPRFLALAYHGLGRHEEARTAVVEALALGRFSTDVIASLARIDRERDDRTALIESVRLLVLLEPENLDWRVIYADLLAAAGALQESATVLTALTERNPVRADIHVRLGQALAEQGSRRKAAIQLETAWRLGMRSPDIARRIASVHEELGDRSTATAWIERALAATPGDAPSPLLLEHAELLLANGDLEKAERAAARIDRSSSGDELAARARTVLGHVASRRSDPEKAAQHLERAIELGASSPQLLSYVGAHHFNAKDYVKAAALLKRRVDEHEVSEQDLRFLILALIRTSRGQDARVRLRSYLERFGLGERARKLIEELWRSERSPPR